jgi:predicted PurR-regulated permease PerM
MRGVALAAITLVFAAAFIGLIWDFLVVLFLAAVFSALAYPLFNWIRGATGEHEKVAVAITLLLVFFCVFIPGLLLLGVIAVQAQQITEQAVPWIQQALDFQGHFNLPDWFPLRNQIQSLSAGLTAKLGELSATIAGFAVRIVSAATAATGQFILKFFILLYAMYYFLRQGPFLLDRLSRYSLLPTGVEERVFQRAFVVTRATVKGTLVVGLAKGLLGGIGFAIFGVPSAALWGAVMAVASLLPVVGAAIIWIPGVVYLLIDGATASAFGLLAWSAFVVSSVDNFLCPILVGGETEMPNLSVLVSSLGGLAIFGIAGLIIGPVIAAIFFSLIQISYEAFTPSQNGGPPTSKG